MTRLYLHKGAKRYEKDDARIAAWWRTHDAALGGMLGSDGGLAIVQILEVASSMADMVHGSIVDDGVEVPSGRPTAAPPMKGNG